MRCKSLWCLLLRRSLSPWVLGAVEGRWDRQIGAHLDSCPDCRAEAERLRQTDRSLRRLLRVPAPPPEIWESIRREIAVQDRPVSKAPLPGRGRGRSRSWAAALAGVAFLLALPLLRHRISPPAADSGNAPAMTASAPVIAESDDFSELYLLGSWRDPLADHASLGAYVAQRRSAPTEARP